MMDDKKLSLVVAADYLKMDHNVLRGLYEADYIQAVDTIGSSPIFLKSVLDAFLKHRRVLVDPVQELIRNRREAIDAARHLALKQLSDLQAECTHPRVKKVNRGNSGNYDPSCDSYWRDCNCPDCGKNWTEDQ